jgi:hypothetical protein
VKWSFWTRMSLAGARPSLQTTLVGLYQGSLRPIIGSLIQNAVRPTSLSSRTDDDGKRMMRGVGGPLLTIGDLLSDLAVDDPLVGVGDASVPSSPSAAQQAGKANPSDLSRLFEVRARFPPILLACLDVLESEYPCIGSSIVGVLVYLLSSARRIYPPIWS